MSVSFAEPATVLSAPSRLVAETRVDFRCAALDCVSRAGESGSGVLTIDLRGTSDVDASGLGILVLVQKKARERGLSTQLLGVPARIRDLLRLTQLEALFQYVA